MDQVISIFEICYEINGADEVHLIFKEFGQVKLYERQEDHEQTKRAILELLIDTAVNLEADIIDSYPTPPETNLRLVK